MTAIAHAVAVQGAQVRNAVAGLARGTSEVLSTLNAAIRIANAIELRRQPASADLEVLGIKGPLPRRY